MVLITVIVVCVVVALLVLGLSIMTINKGYAYQHKVDPLPEDSDEKDSNKEK